MLLMQGLVPVMKQEENIKKVRKCKVDARNEYTKEVESQQKKKKANNKK
ncbi:6773_t:CDS:2, partial [Gigaspora rosea]